MWQKNSLYKQRPHITQQQQQNQPQPAAAPPWVSLSMTTKMDKNGVKFYHCPFSWVDVFLCLNQDFTFFDNILPTFWSKLAKFKTISTKLISSTWNLCPIAVQWLIRGVANQNVTQNKIYAIIKNFIWVWNFLFSCHSRMRKEMRGSFGGWKCIKKGDVTHVATPSN